MKWWRSNRGGIVVEAAIALPFFSALIFAFIIFIQLSIIQLALSSAVSESVKQISTHTYPVMLIAKAVNDHQAVEDIKNKLEQSFPLPLQPLWEWQQEQIEETGQAIKDKLLQTMMKPIVIYYSDQNGNGRKLLDESRLTVTKVHFPDLLGDGSKYFGLEVQYDVTINLPFVNKVISLTSSAVERTWVGL